MHGQADIMVIKQQHAEIRQEAAANRLARELRANRERRFRLMGDAKWELERYAGLLKKRLRGLM
jgi:hypothetical protein